MTAAPKCFRMLRAAALALAIAAGPAAPAAAEPAFAWDNPLDMPPGVATYIPVQSVFSDSGTNPVFDSVTFGTTAYIDPSRSGFGSVPSGFSSGADRGELLVVTMLTNAELNALDPLPDNPFTFTADVTMTNDEGQTASATLTFETTYARTTDEGSQDPPPPVFLRSGSAVTADPGGTLTFDVNGLFDNAGTNPRFTAVGVEAFASDFASAALVAGSNDTEFTVTVATSAELSALETPPPATFGFTVDVEMTNDAGHEASGVIVLETTYVRVEPQAPPPLPPPGSIGATGGLGGDR